MPESLKRKGGKSSLIPSMLMVKLFSKRPLALLTLCVTNIAFSHYLTDVILQGANVIFGDPATVAEFYKYIPGSQYSGEQYWTYPCEAALPSISFNIAGREFPLTKFYMDPKENGSNRCIGAIMQQEDIPYWVLGWAFMRGYYTVFDVANGQVGFATLK
jgi:hypothetical protein